MTAYLWIALGSAIGGCARYALGSALMQWMGMPGFPWGTLTVNITGCFAIGVFASILDSAVSRQLLMVGVCGGFTTFSSFSLETLNLMRSGHSLHAGAYVMASVFACLAAVWCGHAIGAASSIGR